MEQGFTTLLEELKGTRKAWEEMAFHSLIQYHNWKKNNPVMPFDEPIYEWDELEIPVGFRGTFTFTVPGGHIFYMRYINQLYRVGTTYDIGIDGRFEPTLIDVVQDFGDHKQIFTPPRKAQNEAVLMITNLTSPGADEYDVFFQGWLRRRSQEEALTAEEHELKKRIEERY